MTRPIPFAAPHSDCGVLPRSTSSSALHPRSVAHFWQPLVRRDMSVVCADIALDHVSTHAHEGLLVVAAVAPIFAAHGVGREARVEEGSLLVAPPGSPVTLRRVGPSLAAIRLLLIAPTGAGARDLLQPDAWRPARNRVVCDPALHLAVLAMLDELRDSRHDPALGERLHALVAALRSAYATTGSDGASGARRAPPGVRRLRALLQEDPTRSMSLERLADAASLSKYYLLRTFQRVYGLTPHAYQMQLRLARARRLIEAGRPLSFAAHDAGLADQSHLTRRFRDYFGLTPAAYARQVSRDARGLEPARSAA